MTVVARRESQAARDERLGFRIDEETKALI